MKEPNTLTDDTKCLYILENPNAPSKLKLYVCKALIHRGD